MAGPSKAVSCTWMYNLPCNVIALIADVQARFRSTAFPVAQGFHAVRLRTLEPLAHPARTNPQCFGYVFLFPAFLLQFPGA